MTNLSPPAEAILGVITTHSTGTSFVEIENALFAAGFDPDGGEIVCEQFPATHRHILVNC